MDDPDSRHLKEYNGYAPLTSDFDSFYTRRLKHRLDDCFNRPTTGVPGRYLTYLERYTPDFFYTYLPTGRQVQCLNLASYNYLGFAQSVGQCTDAAEEAINHYGVIAGGTRVAGGLSDAHVVSEKVVADFVGKEDAVIYSQGYSTNSVIFSSLVDKDCLVISDELNHASIRFGIRMSGASLKVFKHNNLKKLEQILRKEISGGKPRTHRPWKKILIVVEGLYSMEGTICDLPGLLELKKKYKFYLFVDEAHSIGAMGPKGRGVCDYFGISPNKVDILMGTLTKSFGATGGYIAADKAIVDRVKCAGLGSVYSENSAPPVLAQINSSLQTITGQVRPGEGEERLQKDGRAAGQTFEKAAAAQQKTDSKDEAANTLVEAYKAYKQTDPEDAARVLSQAVHLFTLRGAFRRAAGYQMDLGSIYENDLGNVELAVEAYEKAGDWYFEDQAEA
ncbi:hypothetical protein DV451_001028 [Geotrichum candidum]|uniref:Aminotransferase class I/classII large domain-containing protein n=1 Tax=Geotrichum candidum TaxID=1173061 RepID=A0A9P5G8D2_GEOCN|nr:hypothetical protein DV451_001028 [Geotrichum candidum]KAF5106290.1 hypothetical protein DV453_004078 [Geotrichum candidum]